MAQFQKGKSGNPAGRPPKKQGDNVRTDGVVNLLTGLGSRHDPAAKTTYVRDRLLGENELNSLYMGNGLARRIVELLVDDAMRNWLCVETEDAGRISDYMEMLHLQKHMTDSFVWARLYGGSAIVRLLKDGGTLDQPLNERSIDSIMGYRVYDRFRVQPDVSSLVQDANSERYMLPEFYTVTPIGGTMYPVHHSRITIIDGDRLPDFERNSNLGWGGSVIQPIYSSLMSVGESFGYTRNIIKDFIQCVLAVKGLGEMYANGEEAKVIEYLKALDLSKSLINSMIIDADGGSFTKSASSVAGLAELLREFKSMLAAQSGYPETKLYGRSAAGMNATGEGDQRNYYDMVDGVRKATLSKPLEQIVREIFLAKDGPTRGVEPAEWSIKWNPMWQPTEKETAEVRKLVAETDVMYAGIGVLTPEEIAESRFGNGEYSMHTEIDDVERVPFNPADTEESEDRATPNQPMTDEQ